MKMKRVLVFIMVVLTAVIFNQCERWGGSEHFSVDEDSDRPAWAGGNTDLNTHSRGNDDSGDKKGGDYGDLYKLLRNADGVPAMLQIGEEYYAQPIGVDGNALELNEEGELVNPELATEVEFGRMNLVRSPQSVLDAGLAEATNVLCSADSVSLDFCGRLMAWDADGNVIKTIDSPRENLALYQYMMNNNFTGELACLAEYGFELRLVAASCLAAGSDKTGTIDLDELIYMNGFLDCVGDNPILNEHEHKHYYNYGDCDDDCPENMFKYNRKEVYQHRYIQFQVWDGTYYPIETDGFCAGPVASIGEFMEDRGMFSVIWSWGEFVENVEGFRLATDDAVQVLDYIHGDTNIDFVPGFDPNDTDASNYDSDNKVYWPKRN